MTPSTDRQPSQVRWEPEVYSVLRAYSSATGTSMNVIANNAVAQFLVQPQVVQALTEEQTEISEAIRKLSGG